MMIAEPQLCRRADPKSAGFTLLEVMVAMIIFAIAFGALAGLFQTSLRQATATENLRNATLLAEAQLARFGRDLSLKPGKFEGTSPSGLHWEANISLASPIDDSSEIALYRIRVDAGVESGSESSIIALNTLRIGIR